MADEPVYCNICGFNMEIGPHGHDWSNARPKEPWEQIRDLESQLTTARAEAKAAAVADNGETWESECMRARTQRDEARVEIESARTKVGVLIDDLKRTGQRYEDARAEIARLRAALGEATRFELRGDGTLYVAELRSTGWYVMDEEADLVEEPAFFGEDRDAAIERARALAKGST